MKISLLRMLSKLILATFLLTPIQGLEAERYREQLVTPQSPFDTEQIEDRSSPPNPFARRAPDGNWFMPAGTPPGQTPTQPSPQITGGPDDFGYTWDNWVALDWIDVTHGTDTGLRGFSEDQATGPIAISFPFEYYENTYDEVYISAAGYLSFSKADYWDTQDELLSTDEPNNVIAPYWSPLQIGSTSWVRYLSGGSAPNRYFVVEWHDVMGPFNEDELFRFEAVLHEDGDITFQYKMMIYLGGRYCGTSGIEDGLGLDGLIYVDLCGEVPSDSAVRFLRPPPSARVRVDPPHQGQLISPGEATSFPLVIRNRGDLGRDTFDLFPNSDSWPWELTSEGGEPFSDTNSNGIIDTGPIDQGSTINVNFVVTAPDSAQAGNSNHASLIAQSSKDTTISRTAQVRTAIPAPFAQVLTDSANWAISLYLAQPSGQVVKKLTDDDYDGYNAAITETPDGFAIIWENFGVNGLELEYTLLNQYGEKIHQVSKLTSNPGSDTSISDTEAVLAAAPNGRIGVLWQRTLRLDDYDQSNVNIYMAILDSQGNLVFGPANLTQNNAWGPPGGIGFPYYRNSRIAATTDNHFLLAWERFQMESSGPLEDIFIAVRGPSGGEIKPVTNFTNDTPDWEQAYYCLALAALDGNRVFLAYLKGPADREGTYTVLGFLDSNGNEFRPRTSPSYYDFAPSERDAVQYSNGKIGLADVSMGSITYTTFNQDFQIIDNDTFENPISANGNSRISLAPDNSSHTIITWSDINSPSRLYYGLLNGGDGEAEPTPPMIFYTSSSRLYINDAGYGNTSYSWTPPEGVDGFAELKGEAFNAPPGGIAAVKVYASNYGTTQATNVTLTATLDSALTYLSDSSGIPPTQIGNQLIWNLPNLGLLDYLKFTIYVELMSGADFGSTYPVTLSIDSDGIDIAPNNNLDNATVVAVSQVFLPIARNSYR